MSRYRLGIDLGGTKTEAAILDEAGLAVSRWRVVSPREDYTATLDHIVDILEAAEAHQGARMAAVGMGTPGALSPATGRIKNANSVWLNGQALYDDLAPRLDRPLRIANDANCFALSEATDGAGCGAGSVLGVIIGTGTGAGIVIDGHILTGTNAIAGEWGHNPLPWPRAGERPGPACYCGRSGCLETFLSGPGMTADHRRATGEELAPPAILAGAEAGDSTCDATLRRYEHRLARGLAHVINILDPEVVILGGGMGKIERLYQNVPVLWSAFIFSDRVATRLVPPLHGDASGVLGAARLWPPEPPSPAKES